MKYPSNNPIKGMRWSTRRPSELTDSNLTVTQAAEKLGVSYRTCLRRIYSGVLVPIEKVEYDIKWKRYHFNAEYIRNYKLKKSHTLWSAEDKEFLRDMRDRGFPYKGLAIELGRTVRACRDMMAQLKKEEEK